nr:MAG TPA: hypothetical protein [Caudoviricetes sp.]
MFWKINAEQRGSNAPVMRGNGCNPVQNTERSESGAIL